MQSGLIRFIFSTEKVEVTPKITRGAYALTAEVRVEQSKLLCELICRNIKSRLCLPEYSVEQPDRRKSLS